MIRDGLRARGDAHLFETLLESRQVKRAIEEMAKQEDKLGARRHLLATSLRLTPEMAPDVHEHVDHCRRRLQVETPIEVYVYPDSSFNAAAVRPEGGRLFMMLSSSLLEAFEPDELRFVVGHEVGHHLFRHHDIPTGLLLRRDTALDPGLALQLFSWQRYAEVSCDRAGLVCAGDMQSAARALFKLASGLRGGRVEVRVDQFMQQMQDMADETHRLTQATADDHRAQGDWFATHPFSPLRLKAADLCARSKVMDDGGMSIDELEARITELMKLMDPSYLKERTPESEAMRRLLYVGGIAIAAASGTVTDEERAALERLLGKGSLPLSINADAITEELEHRIEVVNEAVPPMRRAQVIRDLRIVLEASDAPEAAAAVLRRITHRVGVSEEVIDRAFRASFA
jgi:Zn-dependent protease with chaperone function